MSFERHGFARVIGFACFSLGLGFTGSAIAAESPEPSSESKGGTALGSAFVDPLGFLLFGPRVGVDFGAGRMSVGVSGRWFNPGLLAHSLFLEEGEEFAFSYGVGARGRYYLEDRFMGLHLGVGAEYLRIAVDEPPVLVRSDHGYLVTTAEVGYRLWFGRFFGDASLGAGYAAQVSASTENMPGGTQVSLYEPRDESTVYATASLELGIGF